MKRIKQILVCLCVLAVVHSNAQQDTNVAEHYQTSSFNAAIFPAKAFAFLPAKSRFTPTKQDVDKAENALLAQLEKLNDKYQNGRDQMIVKKLAKYGRQYFGYIDSAGHKILYINSIYIENPQNGDEGIFGGGFLKDMIMVDDGGSYFWNVKYNMDEDKLFELEVNGMG